jgi:hypothetical protein
MGSKLELGIREGPSHLRAHDDDEDEMMSIASSRVPRLKDLSLSVARTPDITHRPSHW